MKHLLTLALILSTATAQAGVIANGFSVSALGPSLEADGGQLSGKLAPDGSVWMSNAVSIFRFDSGAVADTVKLRQADGGPIGNTSAATDFDFDASGRLHVLDIGSGHIYRRDTSASPWYQFTLTPMILPRAMRFDSNGSLRVIGGNGNVSEPGIAYEVKTDGSVQAYGTPSISQAMVIDASNNLIIPHGFADASEGTGLDRLAPDGTLTTLWTFADPGLIESIATTRDGNYLLGINETFGPGDVHSSIARVNAITGQRELLGRDVGDALPYDLFFVDDNNLAIAGFASLDPLGVSGDFDGLLEFEAVPEPGTLALLAIGMLGLLGWRIRR